MTKRVTARWIRTFLNAYKSFSLQDKMKEIRMEPNPYYLLEWLVIERTEEDDRIWEAWQGERTPGVEKGSLLDVELCFRRQMLLELLFGQPLSDVQGAKLLSAFADLQEHYGAVPWQEGLERMERRAQQAFKSYEEYKRDIRSELGKMDGEWKREKSELRKEAESFEDGGVDLEDELRKLHAKWEQRKAELPAKRLRQRDPDDALLHYMVLGGLPKPVERVESVLLKLRENAPALAWREAIEGGDVDALTRLWRGSREGLAAAWDGWLSSYMSRSDLTRGWLPVEERQRNALRWMRRMLEDSGDESAANCEAAFRASGWEERLAEPEFSGEMLHRFVWLSHHDAARRKRLREEVILLHWQHFSERFSGQASDHFTNLSWVFALDPESVQQRLLRSRPDGLKADELIRRLCTLYAEAIRRGLDLELVVSLYSYLVKHDKESFYSFVHGMKTPEEALAILRLPAATLSQSFRGDGVRQESARRHLLQLFYVYLESPGTLAARKPLPELQKLADVLSYDKRAAVTGWLQRHERDWRDFLGGEGEGSFTRLLRFRWIGTKGSAEEQHASVQQWLQRHSEWIQFESDAPGVESKGITYKIVKPGAIDAESGELLSRVTVRAEWGDRKEASRLLDDLKLL